MTFDELLELLGERKVLRHQGQCFVNLYDQQEAAQFAKLGSYVRPAGGQDDEWGAACWEAQLTGLLDPMMEDELDVRGAFLLNYFRERDGWYLGTEEQRLTASV